MGLLFLVSAWRLERNSLIGAAGFRRLLSSCLHVPPPPPHTHTILRIHSSWLRTGDGAAHRSALHPPAFDSGLRP